MCVLLTVLANAHVLLNLVWFYFLIKAAARKLLRAGDKNNKNNKNKNKNKNDNNNGSNDNINNNNNNNNNNDTTTNDNNNNNGNYNSQQPGVDSNSSSGTIPAEIMKKTE